MASNPLPSTNDLTAMLDGFRQDSINESLLVMDDLTRVYRRMYTRLEARLEVALNRIWNESGDTISQSVLSLEIQALTTVMEDELTQYQSYLQTVIDNEIEKQLRLGGVQSEELLRVMGGDDVQTLNFEDEAVLAGILALLSWRDGLMERIGGMAEYYPAFIGEKISGALPGLYLSKSRAGAVAAFIDAGKLEFKQLFARPYADSLRAIRTAGVWALREAMRQNFRASGIVTGWIWYAKLDNRTCMSCVSLHGSYHTLDEVLIDHPNGRCSMLPVVNGIVPLILGGEAWFLSLSPEEQLALMGPALYAAWLAGLILFEDLHERQEDPVYGEFYVQPSLNDLLGEDE